MASMGQRGRGVRGDDEVRASCAAAGRERGLGQRIGGEGEEAGIGGGEQAADWGWEVVWEPIVMG